MRNKSLSFACLACLMIGCTSTRTAHFTATAYEISQLCARGCAATVVHDRSGTADLTGDPDSIYAHFALRNITVKLDDGRTLSGRLARVRSDRSRWVLLGKTSTDGREDTVQFRSPSVTSLKVQDRAETRAERLRLNDGLVYAGDAPPIAWTSVEEIRVRQFDLKRGRGAIWGMLAGIGVGTALGLAAGDDEDKDFIFKLNAGSKALLYSVLLAPVGALVGYITGAPKVTIHRFRPETPQQMSIVIGVGPSTNTSGVAR